MRWSIVLALLVVPNLARAQAAQSQGEKAWNEVQQYAAEATDTQQCAVACKALESLARATQQLCEIGPEHCEEARAKLRDVMARVRAACPECQSAQNPPPTMTADTHTVQAAEVSHRGGCAGCATSGSSPEIPWLVAGLALFAARRRRRVENRHRPL
jgi:MYXO-CTERM domain-containing protein